MNEVQHDHPQTDHPHTNTQKAHGHDRGPYWKRAHRDWKLWVAIVLMLFAMAVYLRSNDLSVLPHRHLQQPVP